MYQYTEKSKCNASNEDIIRMYDIASEWLDETDIGKVGLSDEWCTSTR